MIVSEPSLCTCRHVWSIHKHGKCWGWSRKKRPLLWLPFGFRINLMRICPCKKERDHD